MEISSFCRCCRLRPPDRDMKMPYMCFGRTEIYSDMLKECFEIHLKKLLNDDECGICEVCVGRLRDASDFKLQVLQSQAELQAQLDNGQHVKEEEPSVKSEMPENEEQLIHFDEVKLEMSDPLPSDEVQDHNGYELMLGLDNQTSNVVDKPVDDEVCDEPVFDAPIDPARPVRRGQSGLRIKNEANTSNICGQQFAKKVLLNRHKKIHKLDDLTCDICHKEFKYKSRLETHRLTHTKPYACHLCNQRFSLISILDRHVNVHMGDKPFSCDVCNKQFAGLKYFNEHKRLHTADKYTCDICNAQFLYKSKLISHIGRHQGTKYYRCKFCSKRFYEYGAMYHHRQTHGEMSKCGQCEKVFSYKEALMRHLKSHSKRSYPCDFCSKNLATLASLRRHKLVHTGERSHSCEICNKSFSHKQNLLAHQVVHTGEKPHCCEVCGKQFSRKENLKTHLATHAEGRRYGCELCSKAYSTKEGLRQHRRTHKKKKALVKFANKRQIKKKASEPQR